MKRLLLITNYFPPCAASATHRGLAMARHLPAHGWNVTVVTPPVVRWEPNDPGLTRLIPADTKVRHVPFPEQMWARLARRYFPSETWLPGAWRMIEQVVAEERPDAILSTSPPSSVHHLGRWTKRRWDIPWIADMRDPMVTNLAEYQHSPLHKLIDRWTEIRLLSEADRVIANTPSTMRGLKSAFAHHEHKIVLVTNGFDPLPVPAAVVRYDGGGDLTILHAGEFYMGRDPRTLIRVLSDLNRSRQAGVPRFRLQLLGKLDGLIDIQATIREHRAHLTVETPGQVPYREVHKALAAADILLSVQGPGLGHSVPAKLYEYLAYDKPILQLAEPGGDMDWVLETAGVCHRVVAQHDESGLRQALVALAHDIIRGDAAKADPARARAFTREHTAGQLAGILDRIVAERESNASARSEVARGPNRAMTLEP